jgi:hypothetical protein
MEQTVEARFGCDGCGKTFRWKPEIAGKKAVCVCGKQLVVPREAPGAAADAKAGGVRPAVPKSVAAKTAAGKLSVPVTVAPKRMVPVSGVSRPVASAGTVNASAKLDVSANANVSAKGNGAGVGRPAVKRNVPPPPPPEPESSPEEAGNDFGDDLSQLNSLIPSAEEIAAAHRDEPPIEFAPMPAIPVPAGAAVAAGGPGNLALNYRRAQVGRQEKEKQIDPNSGELIDPVRDYIVPTALLAAALASIAGYIMSKAGTGPLAGLAITFAFVVLGAVTLIKTLILTLAAFPLSAYCDVYIGPLLKAILKFASTIIFGEVLILWLTVWLTSAGLIPKRGGGMETWFINYVVVTTVYHGCFTYFFRITLAEIKFSYLMGLVSRLTDLFMGLILLGLLSSLAAGFGHRAASSYVPASQQPLVIAPGTPTVVKAGTNGPTVADDLISEEIRRHAFSMTEGYAWCQQGKRSDADRKLISDLYHAGASKVYVQDFTVYAQIPNTAGVRDACLQMKHDYLKSVGAPIDRTEDAQNLEFVVVNLAG